MKFKYHFKVFIFIEVHTIKCTSLMYKLINFDMCLHVTTAQINMSFSLIFPPSPVIPIPRPCFLMFKIVIITKPHVSS